MTLMNNIDDAAQDSRMGQVLTMLTGAAESGHLRAQYQLSLLYTKGYGVLASPAQAAYWLDRAKEAAPAGLNQVAVASAHAHRSPRVSPASWPLELAGIALACLASALAVGR